MPKLKCIGGMCDGQLVNVNADYKTYDHVRVPAKIEFTISTFEQDLEDFRYGRVPKNMSVPYYMYKLSVLNFSDRANDTLKFLIPVEWSDREAVIYQFGK